ncbi:MAG: MFS transporter [Planctomycetota bacterium]
MFLAPSAPLDRVERYTYHHHVRATLFEGVYMGAMWGAPDIAAKNLGAGPLAITLLTMVPGVASLFSLYLIPRIDRMHRRTLIMTASLLGRLPFVLFVFWCDIRAFVILITLQSIANVGIISSWNALLRTNYRDHLRGRLYGRTSRVQALLIGVTSIGMGVLLDYEERALPYVYAVVAIFGVVACWVFAKIQARPFLVLDTATHPADEPTPTTQASATTGVTTWAAIGVLGRDRAFRWFEGSFFLYGIAFMAAITALPSFGANTLDLDNSQMLGARALFNLLIAICTVHTGVLLDRLGPAKLAAFCYFLLALVMVFFAFTTGPVSYMLSYMAFGVAMSGVQIVWNMGPVHFAPLQEAGKYMGLHMALVGIRAMFGHPLGGWVLAETGNPRLVFWISCVIFVCGALGMWILARRMQATQESDV